MLAVPRIATVAFNTRSTTKQYSENTNIKEHQFVLFGGWSGSRNAYSHRDNNTPVGVSFCLCDLLGNLSIYLYIYAAHLHPQYTALHCRTAHRSAQVHTIRRMLVHTVCKQSKPAIVIEEKLQSVRMETCG